MFARLYFRNIRRLDFDFRVDIRSTTTRLNSQGPSECRSVSLRTRAKPSRSLKHIQVRVRRRWTASRAHGSPALDRVSFEYDLPDSHKTTIIPHSRECPLTASCCIEHQPARIARPQHGSIDLFNLINGQFIGSTVHPSSVLIHVYISAIDIGHKI